jgi:hypothetical protein
MAPELRPRRGVDRIDAQQPDGFAVADQLFFGDAVNVMPVIDRQLNDATGGVLVGFEFPGCDSGRICSQANSAP